MERSEERGEPIRARGQKAGCSLPDYRKIFPIQTIDWFVESKHESGGLSKIKAGFVGEKDGEGLKRHAVDSEETNTHDLKVNFLTGPTIFEPDMRVCMDN